MISVVSSAAVKFLGGWFFFKFGFFLCEEVVLEVKCEVSTSEVHGDASSSY